MPTQTETPTHRSAQDILKRFQRVRDFSLQIAAPLSPEDCAMQTMPDVSPTRWHLAHTTWFFETFALKHRLGFTPFDSSFERLFNSYYNSVGEPFPRHRRGQISRPGLDRTLEYRTHVDRVIQELLDSARCDDGQLAVIELGLQHEQQHQELMFTDIKHVLSSNPMLPAYQPPTKPTHRIQTAGATPIRWEHADETIVKIGHEGDEFAYDNECPRHRTLLHRHEIASRCVTNREYLEFINDGGYQRPEHWLSMGWNAVNSEHWQAPLYWLKDPTQQDHGQWQYFTLAGVQPIQLDAPVCHVSFFEADAYARWCGKRLPTETEWEHAASTRADGDAFADRLMASGDTVTPQSKACHDFLGNVWEWTASPYSPYPGYRPAEGALGEYNGKFMCNQFVLRGGSCATSSDHIRVSYRNFFPPDARWQFSGIRLAK